MSNDLKVWLVPKRHSVEGHTAQCTLSFNGRQVWGPYNCHINTTRLRDALSAADHRFQLTVSGKRKTIEGHTYAISVMAGGHLYLDRLSTHCHMNGLCDAINKCLAEERARAQRVGPDPAPPTPSENPPAPLPPPASSPIPPRPPRSSQRTARPRGCEDFEIAIICALPIEAEAVDALFDHCWDGDDDPPYVKAPSDTNAYSTGLIGRHNIVLIHMPGQGKANASMVTANCRASFRNLKLALVVGICGAVPFTSEGAEIVLGDIVVSVGVVQHDLGRQLPEGFKPKDAVLESLGRPNAEIRGQLAKLSSRRHRMALESEIVKHLNALQAESDLAAGYPGVVHDRLFEATYRHVTDKKLCDECGCSGSLVPRKRLQRGGSTLTPAVHFGLIASGDAVIKSGEHRDALARREKIIAIEMESAGVWDHLPCVVIKSACDYADSHKDDKWQRYAAATAAACAKAFLSR